MLHDERVTCMSIILNVTLVGEWTIINGETYIVAAGNIISDIITTVLPEACQKYKEHFGTQDTHKVVEAVFNTRPDVYYGDILRNGLPIDFRVRHKKAD